MAEYARSLGVKYAGFRDAADLAHIIAVPYRVVFSSILSRFAQVAVNGYRVVASRQPVVTTGIVSRWRGRMLMFRSLTADDFPLLFDWLQRPHVKEWWDDGEDTLYT